MTTVGETSPDDWVLGLGEDLLPHDRDARLPGQVEPGLLGPFRYLGQGLTADEFTAYVQNFNFGTLPPTFVVLHHTAVPGASWGPSKSHWDSGEDGMGEEGVKQQRAGRLGGIMAYYRDQLGWDRGPHLFIDERYIWLFSPMDELGYHAAEGNGVWNSYSIGIEVVGDFTHHQWPEPVARLVGHAIAVLHERLKTFELRYQPMQGGVSSHRDYNKPSCPGAAINNDFYMDTILRAHQALVGGASFAAASVPVAPKEPTPIIPLSADSPILGPDSGGIDRCVAFIRQSLPATSEYAADVELIMSYYWQHAPTVGVDPFVAASQCIFETGGLSSEWAARPKRNPAGLGVRQEGGLSFGNWNDAVQAHIGQLLAFALTDAQANDAQRAMMAKNPRHSHIAAELRGSAPTIGGLSGRWTDNADYGAGLLNRIAAVQQALG